MRVIPVRAYLVCPDKKENLVCLDFLVCKALRVNQEIEVKKVKREKRVIKIN